MVAKTTTEPTGDLATVQVEDPATTSKEPTRVHCIGLGEDRAPNSRELQRLRLVLSLSEYFDVSVQEARRWVLETEIELATTGYIKSTGSYPEA